MGEIAVQRGNAAIGNSGGTDAPGTNFGSLTAAFVLNQNNRRSHGGRNDLNAGNHEGDDMSGMIELTAVDTITISRVSGSMANDMRFDWESWEYTGDGGGDNEFIVRSRNTVTLTGESTTATLDNNPTDIDKCIPFITGIETSSTADDWDSATAVAWISGTNTLNIERGSGSNNTVTVQVVTVEFTGSNWEVFHGDSGDDAADSGTITLVDDADGTTAGGGDVTDWATAAIHHQFKKNSANGVDDSLADTSAVYEPGSGTTTVDWTFNANHVDSVGDDRHFVHVLRHPDMTVTRYSSTGNGAGDVNVDITSAGITDTAEAAVWASSNTSGNGTAYGRGWRNARITSTTNVALWCHRSGNTMAHRVQVIDLSDITTSALAITPAAETVNITAGTLTITTTVDVTPAAETVNVTAGTLTVTQVTPIDPVGPTVTATAGTVTLTTTVGIDPDGPTVTATPGSVSLIQEQFITPSATTVTATGGTLTVATITPIDPVGPTVTITAGTATITTTVGVEPDAVTINTTAGTLNLTTTVSVEPAGPTVTATAGTLTVTLTQPIDPDAVTVNATAGTVTITTGAVNIDPASTTVNVTAGTVTISQVGAGQDVDPDGPTITVTAGTAAISIDVPLTGPTVTTTAGTVTVFIVQPIDPDGPTITTTPGTVTLGQNVEPDSADVTATAGTVSVSREEFITPTATTVTITPGQVTVAAGQGVSPSGPTVTVSAGTMTVTVGAANIDLETVVTVTAGSLSVTGGIKIIYANDTGLVLRNNDGLSPRLKVAKGGSRTGPSRYADWDRVSEQFVMNGTTEGIEEVQNALVDVWATHASSATATLKAAVDQALQDAGFRRSGGDDIV